MKPILSIQLLRFIAAFLVVLTHFSSVQKYNESSCSIIFKFISGFGQSGVDIFFVISGYIMYLKISTMVFGYSSSLNFIVNRIKRIIPLYWFFTLITILIYQFRGESFSIGQVLSSLFLLPSTNAIGEHVPILVVGWTLILEFYFYLLISLTILIKTNSATIRISIISMFFLVISVTSTKLSYDTSFMHYINNSLLVEFILGLICGHLVSKNYNVSARLLISILVVSIIAFLLPLVFSRDGIDRVISWGIPTFIIIYSMVTLENRGVVTIPKSFVKLGDSSYSLYLSHFFTLNIIGMIWSKYFHYIAADFVYVLAPVVSMYVAILIYDLIEKPLVSYTHRLKFKKSDGV
ncbi:acyltransferase family protein [Vibrio splendidus]|uniref:acyltransferase family protein n=1 Tax=Vibrio splendidus TaxID=29497 RepID=UPI000D3AF593|nr:acyltransferase [Vibrio splendidus]PTP29385.1 hypothetical protein CWN92_11765 [Vibrio splendidus]